MKLWEHRWDQTFKQLAVYRLLTPGARKALAGSVRTSGYTALSEIASAVDELAENGFLKLGTRTAAITEHSRDFVRLLRPLYRHPVFQS